MDVASEIPRLGRRRPAQKASAAGPGTSSPWWWSPRSSSAVAWPCGVGVGPDELPNGDGQPARRGFVVDRVSPPSSPSPRRSVGFPVAGTVATVDVAVGDAVTAGQTLATLDVTALTAALHQKQAALDAANLTLQRRLSRRASPRPALRARSRWRRRRPSHVLYADNPATGNPELASAARRPGRAARRRHGTEPKRRRRWRRPRRCAPPSGWTLTPPIRPPPSRRSTRARQRCRPW